MFVEDKLTRTMMLVEIVLLCLVALTRSDQSLECYTCTNVTSLCVCNSITTCPSDDYICFSEVITTAKGKQYTLGCKDILFCAASKLNGVSSVVGRAVPHTCSNCCITSNCNRQLCQDPDPNCLDTTHFDCSYIGTTVNYCADTKHAKQHCKRFCGLCGLIQGGWSKWSQWGPCSVTCDIGMQRRDRTCSNPYPSHGGNSCYGDSRDDRLCYMPGCRACGLKPADIVFVLDSSDSEGDVNFKKEVDFVYQFAAQFSIGTNNVQFSVVTFSSHVRNDFYFNTYNSRNAVLHAIRNISYIGQGTHTSGALSHVRTENLQPKYGARSNSSKYVIVITDGRSDNPDQTKKEATALHALANVISIGIGPRVDKSELDAIASNHHAVQVDSFALLNSIKSQLTDLACTNA